MSVFTADPLPRDFSFPVALPPRLKRLVVENAPGAVCCLLLHFIPPPGLRLHLIAACPSFPVDVELHILGQVSVVIVDFTDNLKITGVANQRDTSMLEIRAPPPPGGDQPTGPPARGRSAAARAVHNGLGPDQQVVRKLTINADVSHMPKEDWRWVGRAVCGSSASSTEQWAAPAPFSRRCRSAESSI
ncbi:hypothetical protein OH76DRAFT_1480966 [Lentinus brumalis]|uniref:Uncharacterized protein n=1 Tax=Lentinus brumalis TaxID=2498619 RepID=A0A371DH50_9APHY|nr:hypothetical protein OH76DRAFT_1480966 [Polyporus brumalis]